MAATTRLASAWDLSPEMARSGETREAFELMARTAGDAAISLGDMTRERLREFERLVGRVCFAAAAAAKKHPGIHTPGGKYGGARKRRPRTNGPRRRGGRDAVQPAR